MREAPLLPPLTELLLLPRLLLPLLTELLPPLLTVPPLLTLLPQVPMLYRDRRQDLLPRADDEIAELLDLGG